ncbi:hypothetical protein [Parageobacillus thermoglucosidasius]|uniref:Uncharacterized protein n=3 Tax=Anoxybacillaceae TaxID=3120669 RepID=A0AAN0YUH0_PARTM|nr:hypothetical protein [Parageobacillus thermoglucosidasius]REK53150.1 MAG: hypothetical protein C6P36_17420 [Geobacillus sp.]ALF12045.1 hypothetical protein AOT13_10340 [Parageobacillus thermoglucosidasius]ANZ32133.1 hypothetical protein BCV53_10355 [Parageobacillus thermoglucosidasius]APM82864.1 hypothetical protein BCV54_10365 [Parageobacillus thermoglucosidasius]KJX68652.1 hypothetical protein WH82_11440 [Parageobacillus thermoglucosidasius]
MGDAIPLFFVRPARIGSLVLVGKCKGDDLGNQQLFFHWKFAAWSMFFIYSKSGSYGISKVLVRHNPMFFQEMAKENENTRLTRDNERKEN